MRRILWVALVVAVLATVVTVACGGGGEAEVQVPAEATWTETGVKIGIGQRLTITATGKVQAGPTLSCGPSGFYNQPRWKSYSVVREAPHLGLIAKIGETGEPFYVGDRFEGSVNRSGRLYLGVNDLDAENNQGAYTAHVTVR